MQGKCPTAGLLLPSSIYFDSKFMSVLEYEMEPTPCAMAHVGSYYRTRKDRKTSIKGKLTHWKYCDSVLYLDA